MKDFSIFLGEILDCLYKAKTKRVKKKKVKEKNKWYFFTEQK